VTGIPFADWISKLQSKPLPETIDQTLALLEGQDYVADRALATVLFLGLRMKRPLFLEGEAGVGKTEIAKVLASALGRRLIRLQCYEGLDIPLPSMNGIMRRR
jgi:MoxR-like ATPase